MSYTMEISGTKKVKELLENLGLKAYDAASRGLYEGAGVMAREIQDAAKDIRTAPFKYAGKGETRLPSPEEKAVIMQKKSMGIARFKKRVEAVNTSVGYSKTGYAMMVGRRKPIPLIANAINSGTSFMQKQAFFRRAVNRGKRPAEEAIIKGIEQKLSEVIKANGGNNT